MGTLFGQFHGSKPPSPPLASLDLYGHLYPDEMDTWDDCPGDIADDAMRPDCVQDGEDCQEWSEWSADRIAFVYWESPTIVVVLIDGSANRPDRSPVSPYK
jgi:hypothetical protein